MASGIKVSDKVQKVIDGMKRANNAAKKDDRVKLAIFKINETEIVVHKEYKEEEMGDLCAFTAMQNEMKDSPSFYALYDCNFQTKNHGDCDGLIFITWCSDSCAKVKSKMVYASSKNSMKALLSGIKVDMQLNDFEQWTREDLAKKIESHSSQTITKIENVDI